jgi:hypothetical protein
MRQAEAYVLMAALLDPIDHIEGQPPVVEFWIGNSRDRTGLTPVRRRRSIVLWHFSGSRPGTWMLARVLTCARCQVLLQAGPSAMYFTGKVPYFTGKVHCGWNRGRCGAQRSDRNKRYISGYVTGGLQESGVTRDASRVTAFATAIRHQIGDKNGHDRVVFDLFLCLDCRAAARRVTLSFRSSDWQPLLRMAGQSLYLRPISESDGQQ